MLVVKSQIDMLEDFIQGHEEGMETLSRNHLEKLHGWNLKAVDLAEAAERTRETANYFPPEMRSPHFNFVSVAVLENRQATKTEPLFYFMDAFRTDEEANKFNLDLRSQKGGVLLSPSVRVGHVPMYEFRNVVASTKNKSLGHSITDDNLESFKKDQTNLQEKTRLTRTKGYKDGWAILTKNIGAPSVKDVSKYDSMVDEVVEDAPIEMGGGGGGGGGGRSA
jgi:hypothetical protein